MEASRGHASRGHAYHLVSARRKTCSNLRDFVSRIGDLTVFRSDPSMASQAETQSRPLMTDPTKRKTYPPRTAGATRWFNHCSESLPATQAAEPAAPRPARLTLGSLTVDQQLAQHVKIPAQHPQPHVAAVAPEAPVPAPLQAVARLQSADRRLHPRMTPPRTPNATVAARS